jgi:hypothetical protein
MALGGRLILSAALLFMYNATDIEGMTASGYDLTIFTSAKSHRKVTQCENVCIYTCERLKIPTASAVGQRKQVLPARVYVKSNARRYRFRGKILG